MRAGRKTVWRQLICTRLINEAERAAVHAHKRT